MIRNLSLLLLPAAFLLFAPISATVAAPRDWTSRHWNQDRLSGVYINHSNGGECYVERRGRGYLFVNEHGTPARFVFTGPNRLEMVAGEWDPRTIVTVQQDRYGRVVLRFDSTGRPGYWVPAY